MTAAMTSAPLIPLSIIAETDEIILRFPSIRSMTASSAPGMICTRKPPAAATRLSFDTLTPSAHTVGVCSLDAKYSVISSPISPETMGETPL